MVRENKRQFFLLNQTKSCLLNLVNNKCLPCFCKPASKLPGADIPLLVLVRCGTEYDFWRLQLDVMFCEIG